MILSEPLLRAVAGASHRWHERRSVTHIALWLICVQMCIVPLLYMVWSKAAVESILAVIIQLSHHPHTLYPPGKGTYIHSPFLVVAIVNLIGPSFGLPFITASLPHSPQFVLALTDTDSSTGRGGGHAVESETPRAVTSENRVAPLLVYLLIGLVSLAPSAVRCIPLGMSANIRVG